jgi:hypothetical protein
MNFTIYDKASVTKMLRDIARQLDAGEASVHEISIKTVTDELTNDHGDGVQKIVNHYSIEMKMGRVDLITAAKAAGFPS